MSGYQWQFVSVVYVMELKSGLFVPVTKLLLVRINMTFIAQKLSAD